MKKLLLLAQTLLIIVFSIISTSPAYSGISIQLNNGSIDQDNELLILQGINFDAFNPPIVTVGDILMSGCSVGSTLIECSLTGSPALLLGGTWKVTVSAGNSPHTNSSIDVFVPEQLTSQLCFAGDSFECYSGDPATRDVSTCTPGVRFCQTDGTWGICEGEVLPQTQSCGFGQDEDCDSLVDYADPDCASSCTDIGNLVCGTECIDISTDPSNCGACGSACDYDEACVAGACELSCTTPELDCGTGVCIDISTDPSNCGACGSACSSGEACVAGACV